MAHDIFKVPNLISLGRLILLAPAGYYLAQPGNAAKIYALCFLTLAAVSDFFDGYLARRLNQRTSLGLLLDPLSDKALAGVLAILLIVYRDFPIWLAGIIIGRDVLIALGGLMIRTKIALVAPSNLTGKYSFASTAVLLISYVIDFEFGIRLFMAIALVFILLSLIMYGRSFRAVLRNRPIPCFADKPIYRALRISTVWIISAIFLYQLGQYIGWL